MNEENKKNSFYNLSVITDKAEKLVSLIEEEINNELEDNKSSNTYLVCCPHIPPKKELPEEPPGLDPEEEVEVVGVFCFPPV